jgi:hypothetical protein
MTITVCLASDADLTYFDSLQRKNAEELSFYPKAVFEREIGFRRILLARVNNEPAGYVYHGELQPVTKIHQACIQYDLRGQLYGAALVRFLRDLCAASNVMSLTLRCGSDIAANGFWRAMGFYCQAVTPGGVRRMRDINNWRMDIAPQLLVSEASASERKQDASIWRKGKDGGKSQFMRGNDIAAYRAEVIERASKK